MLDSLFINSLVFGGFPSSDAAELLALLQARCPVPKDLDAAQGLCLQDELLTHHAVALASLLRMPELVPLLGLQPLGPLAHSPRHAFLPRLVKILRNTAPARALSVVVTDTAVLGLLTEDMIWGYAIKHGFVLDLETAGRPPELVRGTDRLPPLGSDPDPEGLARSVLISLLAASLGQSELTLLAAILGVSLCDLVHCRIPGLE